MSEMKVLILIFFDFIFCKDIRPPNAVPPIPGRVIPGKFKTIYLIYDIIFRVHDAWKLGVHNELKF